MKTLIVLLFAGLLFTGELERGEVSYRIQNETSDSLFAEVWINGSCFNAVRKVIPPGTTREIYSDMNYKVKESFKEGRKHLIGMLTIYRLADYRKLFKPDSTFPAILVFDPSVSVPCMSWSQQHWNYHARPGNRGIALLKVKESDLLK